MTFEEKDWRNSPTTTTPLSAAALKDQEKRLAAYTDSQVNPQRRGIDVREWEAWKGDLKTDNSAVIQAAIDEASVKLAEDRPEDSIVNIPTAWTMAAGLKVKAPIRIQGGASHGTKIVAPPGTGASWVLEAELGEYEHEGHLPNFQIRDITFDGNGRSVDIGGLLLNRPDRLAFQNVQVRHFLREGVRARSIRESWFNGLYVFRSGNVETGHAQFAIVEDNTLGAAEGSNNVHFYGLFSVYGHGHLLLLEHQGTGSLAAGGNGYASNGPQRNIILHGGLLHGVQSNWPTDSGESNDGYAAYSQAWPPRSIVCVDAANVRGVKVLGTRMHSAGRGFPIVRLRQSLLNPPVNSVDVVHGIFGQNQGPETFPFTSAIGTELTASRSMAFQTGAQVKVSSPAIPTSLPEPLAVKTNYWAIRVSDTVIKLATSKANAEAGTAISLTSTGSGTIEPIEWTVTASTETSSLTSKSGPLYLGTGACVRISSDGTVPTGLAANTDYFAIRVSDTVVKLATTRANAEAGTAITLSGAGTGTIQLTIRAILGEVESTSTQGEGLRIDSNETETVRDGLSPWVNRTTNPELLKQSAYLPGTSRRGPRVNPNWTPTDRGMHAWPGAPETMSLDLAPTAGVVYLARCKVQDDFVASSMYYVVSVAGSGVQLPVNVFLGVYGISTVAGILTATLLGSTADQSTPVQTPGVKSAELTAASGQSLSILADVGDILLGLVIGTQSTTAVKLPRPAGGNAGLMNIGLSGGASFANATFGTVKTALPGSFGLSEMANNVAPWMAV